MGQTVAQTDRAEQNETKQEAAFPARQMSEWAGEWVGVRKRQWCGGQAPFLHI